MTRNTRVYLVTEALLAGFGGFILPIYVLYFRYYHVTLFEVALLAAIFEASVLVAEIPTGLFADRYGRRLSVNIGFALFAASGAVFILFRHLSGFIVAEILFGLAEAFISGAAEALAVDSIPAADKTATLKKLYTLRSRIRIAVTAILMITASHMFIHNVDITFYPVLAGGLAGFLVSFLFVSDGTPSGRGAAHLVRPLKLMIRRIRLSPVIRVVLVMSLMANFSFEAVDQYWQVLLSELFDVNVARFGYLTAAGAVLAFISVGPCVRRFSGGLGMPVLVLLVAGVLISSLPNAPAFLLPYLMILYFVCKEMVAPMFSVAINSIIGAEGRATFLSGYNLTCSIGEVASGLLVGLIASRLGLPVVFVVCGGILTLSILAAMIISRSTIQPSSGGRNGGIM